MPTIVKYICYILLTVCTLGWIEPQEEKVTPYKTMPLEMYKECIQTKEPTAAKTMAHLYDGRTAIPAQIAIQGARTSIHCFKSKCMSTAIGSHHLDFKINEASNIHHFLQQPYFYTIDYYIYTLEHILI